MISFVIPTYNEEKYLIECLNAIKAQSIEKEIIVVDGGSTDKTLEIAGDADKIIEDIDGRGKARDCGAKEARGKYIAFIDADTCIREGYCSKMVDFVEDNDLGAATSHFKMTGIRSKLIQTFGNAFFERRDPPVLPGFNTFVKREVYEDSKGFEDILGEDLQFSDEIARHTDTGVLDEKLVVNSGRRVRRFGLSGTAIYYGAKDITRRKQNIQRKMPLRSISLPYR